MSIPENLSYTRTHEWVKQEDDTTLIVGITDFAQKELTDITFVELPEVGIEIKQDDEIAVVESTKHASDIYSPVSGTVIEVNEQLENQPEILNTDPYEAGWMFKIKATNLDELKSLLTPAAYQNIAPE